MLKNRYSGYGIGFDIHGSFSIFSTGLGNNFWSKYELIEKD